MSTRDPIADIDVPPEASQDFVAGMAHALSDHRGEVIVKIRANNGRAVVKLEREAIDQDLPMYLRKQVEKL